MNNAFKIKVGVNSDPQSGSVVTTKGDIAYNSATDKLELYNGAVDPMVQEAKASTLTNKIIDASNNTLSNISNTEIKSAAAIAVNKLAALSANTAVQTNASGFISSSSVTSTELGYVSGVTSAIQTQLNGKQATGNYITALTGDVTASGPGSVAATIASNAVTNSKLAQMAAHTIKGNNTGSTANASDLTATQVTAELNNFVGDSGSGGTKGLVPAPAAGDAAAGKFLKADGTWTTVTASGFTAPTVQKFTASSGTYTRPTSPTPLYIKVIAVGGGGGGGSSGVSGGATGTSGANTTFGTSLIVANGGSGGAWGGSTQLGGAGGTASLGSGPIGFTITGTNGQGCIGASTRAMGGEGGNSPLFSGGGSGGLDGGDGFNAVANTGGGGGGGGSIAAIPGAGGGSGGYVQATITSPSTTYSYTVGDGGSRASAGVSGFSGGNGAAGIIIVEEYYQ